MASAQLLMVGFTPIAQIIAIVYDCSPRVVELQSLIFLAAFVPANFLAIFFLPWKGLAMTLRLGALFVILGGWLRLIVSFTKSFPLASIGSIVAAFGQTFFYCSASKIAS